jgi:hypothetical protein
MKMLDNDSDNDDEIRDHYMSEDAEEMQRDLE